VKILRIDVVLTSYLAENSIHYDCFCHCHVNWNNLCFYLCKLKEKASHDNTTTLFWCSTFCFSRSFIFLWMSWPDMWYRSHKWAIKVQECTLIISYFFPLKNMNNKSHVNTSTGACMFSYSSISFGSQIQHSSIWQDM
jgi:hypothetical protein